MVVTNSSNADEPPSGTQGRRVSQFVAGSSKPSRCMSHFLVLYFDFVTCSQLGWTMIIDLFSSSKCSLMDVAALPDHMKALSVSPSQPTHSSRPSQFPNSVDRRVSPPSEFIKSLDPFGLPVDPPTVIPYMNPWSNDYFIGGVGY